MTTAPAKKAALKAIADALLALDEKKRFRKIDFFVPYPKQQAFFDLGSIVKERMFRAGNQLGKTEAGAVELVYHLTGEYPDDWFGFRFDRPVKAWACGISAKAVRDAPQTKLVGEPGLLAAVGTGYIPKAAIVGAPSTMRGVTDALDTVHVKHKSGGTSTLSFKSYEQGRLNFQGATVDVIWLDEEPPMDIYTECRARLLATKGIMYTTFTPLQGRTPLFLYMTDPSARATRREVVMTAYDIPGVTKEELDAKVAAFPAHEREARLSGTPMQGEGAIFATPREFITEAPIEALPLHWHKIWGIDFGIDHPFAAVLAAWDKDTDTIHVVHTIRVANATPIMHAASMIPLGANVPVAWPQDGTKRESMGDAVASQYKKAGLRMLENHSTFEAGGYSTEAGVLEMDERFKTGRLKIAAPLSDILEEYGNYHRKDGLIVKINDDLLSALRQIIMMKRYARQGPMGAVRSQRIKPGQLADHAVLSGDDLF